MLDYDVKCPFCNGENYYHMDDCVDYNNFNLFTEKIHSIEEKSNQLDKLYIDTKKYLQNKKK